MKINSKNVYAVQKYVKALRELNKYVKENFSNYEKNQLSISPVIRTMHIEFEELEQEINKYLQPNINEYIHKDMYLYGTPDIYSNTEYIHILTNPERKRVYVEKVCINERDGYYKNRVSADCSESMIDSAEKKEEMLCITLINSIMDGKLVEITKDDFDNVKKTYFDMLAIQNNYNETKKVNKTL